MHAALAFAFDHKKEFSDWHLSSNYIVVLAAKDEGALKSLSHKLQALNRKFSVFREPDLENEWTSICIEPHDENKKLLSSLPLAGKPYDHRRN